MKVKNVLVTGGAGFIGSYVVEELLARNYNVCIIDNLSKSESKYKKNPYITFAKVDLTDKEKARKYFSEFDQCIHLAAKIGVIGYFHKYPATILSENNKLYSTVFELAAQYKYKKIVYISSSMVFESAQTFPSQEKDIPVTPPPLSAYGFSKLVGEYYCKAFYDEYKLSYTIIRPFNAYGINELPTEEVGYSHVIPDLIRKILLEQYPLEILGDGTQTRCFTHAKDIARAIVMALENKDAINEDFNIGTDKETNILQLAEKIYGLCDTDKPFKYKLVKSFPYDVKRRVPDVSKAKKILGWTPEISLNDSLPKLIEWIKNHAT